MSQPVDLKTAQEFMKETLNRISLPELEKLCLDLERKSQFFQQSLAPAALNQLDEAGLRHLLGRIFSVRRKRNQLLEKFPAEQLRSWIADLLYGEEELAGRVNQFCQRLEGWPESLRFDLAGELLHFSQPDQHWLWTRWIWDPRTRTGALPLVIHEAYELSGQSFGETYLKIGQAQSFLRHVGEAAEMEVIARGPFGVDAFLACVYVVYVYTVLRMRMTQEFSKVMPGLPEFTRRLLGVFKKEEKAHAS